MGRFLRRTGLDELPQLWNVVRGDMAIIGPRPEQADLIELYEPWQHERHVVRPGITGWWQIHHRDGSPLHLNVDKDLYYIQNQGPWIDGLIVLGTGRIMLAGLSRVIRRPRWSPQVGVTDGVAEGEHP
jgi:lipopolysaccharide/colanic/teichoic acid biosynthesis glycosyltransferase